MGKTRQHVMSDEVGIGKIDVNELGGGSSLVERLMSPLDPQSARPRLGTAAY